MSQSRIWEAERILDDNGKRITALRKIQKSIKISNSKDPEKEPSYHRVDYIPECRGAVSHQVYSMK